MGHAKCDSKDNHQPIVRLLSFPQGFLQSEPKEEQKEDLKSAHPFVERVKMAELSLEKIPVFISKQKSDDTLLR